MNLFDDGRTDPFHRVATLEQLRALADTDFVNCAFVTMLGRQADPDGLSHYTGLLRSGSAKLGILWDLRRSREGRRHDPGIAGLDRALRRHHRANLPIVGWFLRLWTAQEGNSPLERQLRVIENSLQLENDRSTARFSLLHHHIIKTDAKLDALYDLTRAALRGGSPLQKLAEAEDTGRESWERTLQTALDG